MSLIISVEINWFDSKKYFFTDESPLMVILSKIQRNIENLNPNQYEVSNTIVI